MAEQERTFLKFLIEATPRQVKLLLTELTARQVTAITEICLNLLEGAVDPEILKDLKKHRQLIRQLADSSVQKKRALIKRKYGAVAEIVRRVESMLP